MVLDEQCGECPYGELPCPIAIVQTMFNYDQCNIPKFEEAMNQLVNEKGECMMFKLAKTPKEPCPLCNGSGIANFLTCGKCNGEGTT
jgi:DnaJ-class molecular chaperone